jgi:hypothetical protein
MIDSRESDLSVKPISTCLASLVICGSRTPAWSTPLAQSRPPPEDRDRHGSQALFDRAP